MAIPSGYTPLAKIGLAYKGTYVSGTNYKQLDAVYYLGSTYLALIDNPAGSPNNDGVNWRYLAQGAGEDISDSAVTFTQATTRANINSGEQNKTIMGKIKKWFADLTAAAFSQVISSYTDLMANTASGYLPDALAVKEGFNEINSNLNGKINESDFVLLSGMLSSDGVFTADHNIGHVPHILSAEIQLESGIWSDMRIYNNYFINIAVDSMQLRVDRKSNATYANFQVRFLLMK